MGEGEGGEGVGGGGVGWDGGRRVMRCVAVSVGVGMGIVVGVCHVAVGGGIGGVLIRLWLVHDFVPGLAIVCARWAAVLARAGWRLRTG